MNRQGLEQLIAFGIHLSLRNNAGWIRGHPGEELVGDLVAARDAVELSGIARRLHYLSGRPASPFGLDKLHRLRTSADVILAPYGYWAWRTAYDPIPLFVVPTGSDASPQNRKAVPY